MKKIKTENNRDFHLLKIKFFLRLNTEFKLK